jgi:predicted ribosome quality control (RQC) complex YloA/Tae2 family protein
VDIQFGKGEFAFHILVEFYAQGNVILTDHEYTILSLLRSHKFDENSKSAIREIYPFNVAANINIDNITLDPEEIKKYIDGVEEPEEKPAEEK